MTTNSEPPINEGVTNKSYLDTKLSKTEGQTSLIEKDYNEDKIHNNKKSVEVVLIQRAVKTTFQILYDEGFLDKYDNADKVLKKFFVCWKT